MLDNYSWTFDDDGNNQTLRCGFTFVFKSVSGFPRWAYNGKKRREIGDLELVLLEAVREHVESSAVDTTTGETVRRAMQTFNDTFHPVRFGFFEFQGSDPDRVVKEYGLIALDEKSYVMQYLYAVKEYVGYRGFANSRMDGSMLGTRDMITPDMRFIFPEKWGEHYVGQYNISPPQEVIDAALKWCQNQVRLSNGAN